MFNKLNGVYSIRSRRDFYLGGEEDSLEYFLDSAHANLFFKSEISGFSDKLITILVSALKSAYVGDTQTAGILLKQAGQLINEIKSDSPSDYKEGLQKLSAANEKYNEVLKKSAKISSDTQRISNVLDPEKNVSQNPIIAPPYQSAVTTPANSQVNMSQKPFMESLMENKWKIAIAVGLPALYYIAYRFMR